MFSFYAKPAERSPSEQYCNTIESSFLDQMLATEDFREKLKNLGLSQYETALCDNGFEDWKTILDITEQDFVELGFKLGHRRILQREISRYRLCSFSQDRASKTQQPIKSESRDTLPPTSSTLINEKRNKRRYRWHPRPDPNAPKRPKTAYVQFADQLRAQ
jgi:hypothetical protein